MLKYVFTICKHLWNPNESHKCFVTIVKLHQTALKSLDLIWRNMRMNFDIINYRTSFPFPFKIILIFVNFLCQIVTHSRSTIFSFNNFLIFFLKELGRFSWKISFFASRDEAKENLFIEKLILIAAAQILLFYVIFPIFLFLANWKWISL